MADLPGSRRRSSSSSSDLSVRIESEVAVGRGSSSKMDDATNVRNGGPVNNGACSSSGVSSRVLSKVKTMPAEISPTNKSGSSPDQFKLERSKTERQRHLRPEDAAQIFDDKIPVKEKLKLLNRVATVKDDGTVEFEVPGDVEPEALGALPKHVHNVVDNNQNDTTDPQHIPPLQIVMLIVGTRGDVLMRNKRQWTYFKDLGSNPFEERWDDAKHNRRFIANSKWANHNIGS